MHKNKFVLFLVLLLACTTACADVETTDKVVISELTVAPGSSDTYTFTVSLQGKDVYYTAYQVDITFPEGLSVKYSAEYEEWDVFMSETGFYPRRGNHTLSCNMISANTLRVACFSTTNKNFTDTSGDLFDVDIQASPYLKPGYADIKVSAKLVTVDEMKHIPAEYTSTSVQVGSTSTLGLKVSAANQFGTCILPFDYTLPADGSLKAYTCNNHTTDALLLTLVADKMQAFTPYILYSPNGFSATISGEIDATQYPEDGFVKQGFLVGTLVQKELTTPTSYVMQNQGNGPLFYHVGTTPFVLAAGKCYAELPEGSEVRSMRFDDDATGIYETENGKAKTENGEGKAENCFDLSGRRIEKLQKGIYIVNGQKRVNW